MKFYKYIKTIFCLVFFLALNFTTSAQQTTSFSKHVSVFTKCPSLSCPYLLPRLQDGINKRSTKITNVLIDKISYQKISFNIVDSMFYRQDSVLKLFARAGYPSIEMVKLEMEGKEDLDLTKKTILKSK